MQTIVAVALLGSLVSSARAEPATVQLGDQIFLAEHLNRGGRIGTQAASGLTEYRGAKWAQGILSIRFAEDIDDARRAIFLKACAAWSRAGNIRCLEGSPEEEALTVNLGAPGECNATVGHHPGYNAVRLGEGCWTLGIIAHELGHVLGLIHEHQRASRVPELDRDAYITINWDNIEDNPIARGAFSKMKSLLLPSEATAYDFGSIMHYHPQGFSRGGGPTFSPTPGHEEEFGRAGRSWWCSKPGCLLSALDKKAAAFLYGPPAAASASAR